MVKWLELGTFSVGAWVQSLVGELRSQKMHGTAEKKKKVMFILCEELFSHRVSK